MSDKAQTYDDDKMRATVRDAIADQGKSVYHVAMVTGLHDQQLRGWINGKRTMIRSDLLARVMDHLDMKVCVVGEPVTPKDTK